MLTCDKHGRVGLELILMCRLSRAHTHTHTHTHSSRHPSSLIPSLLHLILTSHLSTTDPSFLSLCQIIEFLSRSHRDTLRQCVVRVVEELMGGGERTSWGGRLLMLLNLATHSLPLLDAVSHDSLRVGTC